MGVFPVYAGPHAILAVADPQDPVRPANRFPGRMPAYTAPRRSGSRRDPVQLATTTTMWAAAGLKAATWTPRPRLQQACSHLTASFKPFRAS
jgi:hypothetical protein